MSSTILVILLILVVAVLVIYAVVTYNGLVRRRNETEEAYRQIDVQLKRRYDLIPNLLEGVKKYFRQEQEVLREVTQARSQAMQPQSPSQQAQSEARLSGALVNLFAVAENYPELRSDRVLLDFQEELSSTENKISFARQHYNDSVQSYNTSIQSFPARSEEHTSELQSRQYLVCRLLLEKKQLVLILIHRNPLDLNCRILNSIHANISYYHFWLKR